MSSPSPSYASVVAGSSKKTTVPKRSAAAPKNKSRESPLEFVKKFTPGGGEVLVQVGSSSRLDNDVESAQATDTETEEDAGKYLDADDSMYRGKPTKNCVDPPTSIIQTRRARARESAVDKPSATPIVSDAPAPKPKPTPVRKESSKVVGRSTASAQAKPLTPSTSKSPNNLKKAPSHRGNVSKSTVIKAAHPPPSTVKASPKKIDPHTHPKGRAALVESDEDTLDPSPTTPNSKRRRVHSKETASSSADESDSAHTPRRLKRLRRSDHDAVPMNVDARSDNDDDEMAAGSEVEGHSEHRLDPDSDRESIADDEMLGEDGADTGLVESEAEESPEPMEAGSDDGEDTGEGREVEETASDDGAHANLDQYDLDDPFINDTGVDDPDEDEDGDRYHEQSEDEPHLLAPPSSTPPTLSTSSSKKIHKPAKTPRTSKKLGVIVEDCDAPRTPATSPSKAPDTPIPPTSSPSNQSPAPLSPATPSKKKAKPPKTTKSSTSGRPPQPAASKPAASTPTTPNTPQTPRRSFGSMATPSANRPTRYLQDLQYSRLKRSWEPKVCEVSDEILQDDILKEDYTSGSLCNLQSGQFSTWSEAQGDGMMYFGDWAPICPNMNFDSCCSAIRLQGSSTFINPSRDSPCDVLTRELPGVSNRFHMYTLDRKDAICVTSIMVTESCLLTPPAKGLRHLRISGVVHSQEWERLVAFTCGAFRQPVLAAQIHKDALQFSTRTEDKSAVDPKQPEKKGRGGRSPAIATSSNSAAAPSSVEPYTRRMEDPVPVYDCRDVDVDFAKDLGDLSKFPRWEGEIPLRSFVVVGYTIAVFKSSARGWSVTFNIHWAIILGIPEDTVDEV